MQEVPLLPCDISHSFILTACILLQNLHEQMTSLRAELYKVRQTHTYIHTHMHACTHTHTLHIDSLIDQASETGNWATTWIRIDSYQGIISFTIMLCCSLTLSLSLPATVCYRDTTAQRRPHPSGIPSRAADCRVTAGGSWWPVNTESSEETAREVDGRTR